MRYYKVYVASAKFQGKSSLTYSHTDNLTSGTVVVVQLRKTRCLGIIVGKETTPHQSKIKVIKPLTSVLKTYEVAPALIELVAWLTAYYPSGIGTVTALVLPSYLGLLKSQVADQNLHNASTRATLPSLSPDQFTALKTIKTSDSSSVLLHGETASGKTRVYLELAKETLKKQSSVIILTPEIGLTSQLAQTFLTHSTSPVIILHSNLTASQRRSLWQQIALSEDPVVVIGPRSALFAPLKSLGLIVIDEFHDSAYRQSQQPKYSTERVAGRLAQLTGARLILGSATPPVHDYYAFKQKNLPIIHMESLTELGSHKKSVTIIDQKQRQHFTQSPYVSNAIVDAIGKNIQDGRQALLFLNRRGSARAVACSQCGWQARCPSCYTPLVFHKDLHLLRCHSCGKKTTAPSSCPDCENTDLTFRGIGTKALVDEISRLFPASRIARLDADTEKSQKLESIYEDVYRGKFDIIIGTQMIAKGLDLPLLRTVGIISADTSLYLPDFSAEERTYQLIRQVLGRTARGHGDGAIYIQTYEPDSAAIRYAAAGDYPSFYAWQLALRKKYHYPPFYSLLILTTHATNVNTLQKRSESLIKWLSSIIATQSQGAVEISQPTPCFIEKVGTQSRWQIVVKATTRKLLLDIITQLPNGWQAEIDPQDLL
jgi:primosomal protein N' (replication factor Y) (superfamily II helicase)